MAAVSGVNIAMLPEEHAEFWEYLATTGDVWARALADGPHETKYAPAPPAQFCKRFANKLVHYGCVEFYLGVKEVVLRPPSVKVAPEAT